MGDSVARVHTIKKGLDLPLRGAPEQVIEDGPRAHVSAILADDYIGMKPRMMVKEGDAVKRGQFLFEDRKTPGVFYTSPAAGTVKAIHRGARRALRSVVIEHDETEAEGAEPAEMKYRTFTGKTSAEISAEELRALLLESGFWTAFRARPFSKVPSPEDRPAALFVTATDTHPLAADPEWILEGNEAAFRDGLTALVRLAEGRKVYLCTGAGSGLGHHAPEGVEVHAFAGPHPAGTVGLHIHTLEPVGREKSVWHLGYQDVLALGRFLETGRQSFERVVALAGPPVKRPRLLRTRLGAPLDGLVDGELADGEHRVVSGSLLSGRAATGEVEGYLGRYHTTVSVLREDHERVFLGWLGPGFRKFSILPLFLAKFFGRGKNFDLTTSTHGSRRSIVPIGVYERVMPMDIMPTFLLRALMSGDLVQAEELGALELDEEDLGLMTFVCPCKNEYGPALREVLTTLEKEG